MGRARGWVGSGRHLRVSDMEPGVVHKLGGFALARRPGQGRSDTRPQNCLSVCNVFGFSCRCGASHLLLWEGSFLC